MKHRLQLPGLIPAIWQAIRQTKFSSQPQLLWFCKTGAVWIPPLGLQRSRRIELKKKSTQLQRCGSAWKDHKLLLVLAVPICSTAPLNRVATSRPNLLRCSWDLFIWRRKFVSQILRVEHPNLSCWICGEVASVGRYFFSDGSR